MAIVVQNLVIAPLFQSWGQHLSHNIQQIQNDPTVSMKTFLATFMAKCFGYSSNGVVSSLSSNDWRLDRNVANAVYDWKFTLLSIMDGMDDLIGPQSEQELSEVIDTIYKYWHAALAAVLNEGILTGPQIEDLHTAFTESFQSTGIPT